MRRRKKEMESKGRAGYIGLEKEKKLKKKNKKIR